MIDNTETVSGVDTDGNALGPASGFTGGGLIRTVRFGIAVDRSGNVWIGATSSITELIGAAAPVATPLLHGIFCLSHSSRSGPMLTRTRAHMCVMRSNQKEACELTASQFPNHVAASSGCGLSPFSKGCFSPPCEDQQASAVTA